MPAIDLNQCKVFITSSKHEEFPDAVSYVNVKVRRPGCKDPVAVLIAYLINRDRFPPKEFHPMMDDISEELGTFSSKVFDVDGNLRGKFIDHEYHRGTGCWGRELDRGMLVYIDYMRVEKEYRRKGLASLALQALITSKYVRAKDFVVTLPCYLTPDVNSDEERVKQLDISRAFFYKHGFRRIGRTEFTAFTPVPEHPSHLVEVSDDVPSDELIYQSKNSEDWSDEQEIDCSLDDNGRFIRVVVDRKYAATWPLHNAIAAATDASPTTSGIKDLILHSYSTQPASIHTQDREGYTLLHIAARELNYSAVETLLSLKATPSHTSPNETSNLVVLNQLTKRDNVLGSTPLELCEETLLHNREKFESLAQGVQVAMWPGYQERGLKVAYALRCLMGIDIGGAHNEGEYANLKRWGCTCGECAGGWLSGRMRFMLQTCAAETYKHLSKAYVRPDFEAFYTTQYNEKGLCHLPLDIRPEVDDTFYDAFAELFEILQHLLTDVRVPTAQNLLEAIARMPRSSAATSIITDFIAMGGDIDYALDAITYSAGDACEGEALVTFDEVMADDPAWLALPRCKNDRAFYMVRTRMGLDPLAEWGPYEDLEAEEGKTWEERMAEARRMAEKFEDSFGQFEK